jgi:PAS domain S-box-containing protein
MTNKRSKKESKASFLNNYSVVIKEINVPGCFLDPKGTFLLSNPACDDLFGIKKGELVGKNLKDFVSPTVIKKVKKWIQGKGTLSEFEILENKGNKKTLYVMSSPKYEKKNKKRKYTGSLILFEDITDKKKFECKLEEKIYELQKELVFKSNLLSSLLHKTPDHIYFKDKKSRFVQTSIAFLKKLRVKKVNEVFGKTDFDFFTKSHAEQAYREEQEMIKTKKPVTGKVIKETYLDGRTAWVSTTKVPWYDEEGEVIGILGISKDITEIKELDEKLKKRLAELGEEVISKSNLLSSLLDNTPDNIYFKDKKSRFIAVSKSQAEWLGAAGSEDVIGKTDFDYFTKEHAEQAFRDEQKIIKTGKPIKGKVEKETRPDGRVTWVSTTKIPRYDEEGKIIGTLGISRDVTGKVKLEEKLKERLEQLGEEVIFKSNLLSSLLDNTPDNIYFKDKKSRFIAVSKSLSKWIGAGSPEEMIGKTDFDYFTKEHAEPAFRDEMEIIKTGKSIKGKVEKETYPDGRISWVSTTKIPRYDEVGKIIGTLGISREITQLKKMEEQLKESKVRTLAILSALPDLLFQVKKDGTFISYYTGSKDLLHAKPGEFLHKKIQEILPKKSALTCLKSIKKAIEKNETVSFEYQLPINDEIKDWEARVTKSDKDTAILLIRDITERKKAQRERTKLNDLIEQSSDAIFRMDTKMHIDYTNKATKELLGYTFSELKEKTLEFLIAEPDSEEIHRRIFRKVSSGKIYSGEHLGIRKNGSVFFCHVKIIPLFDENGKIYSYMASLRDTSEERKASEELVFRKNLLDSFLELTPDKIFFKDKDCRFVEVSKSKAEKHNLTREGILGKSDFSIEEEKTAEKYFEEEQDIMNNEEPLLDQEAKYVDPDGTPHWISYTKVPRYDKKGKVIGIIGISRDITKLKKVEEELRKEEQLLSNTLESMEDGILVLDQDFHFTYWNNSMEKITKVSRDEVLNSTKLPWEMFPNLKQAKVDKMMKQAMAGEVVKKDKISYESKDGTKLFTSEIYLPLRNPEGQIYGIVGVVKEITKEIVAEETLKESEEKYRILVENSKEGICIFRANRFLFVNDYLCDILRYNKKELYEMDVWEIICEEDRSIVKEMERRREKGEEMPDVYEANIITKKGDLRFCEFSIRKITYQGLQSFMGIIRDITEYKDMEKEREKADRLESLGILAGGIAHDFNNFLTGILGNISLAKLHLDPQDEVYDILDESEKAAQSARSLTQQLLTFSKGGRPVKVNIDIEDLIRSSTNFVLSGSNVRCNFEFSKDLWDVKADKGQISQVFNNLILNADQAMPEGGVLTIRGKNLKVKEGEGLPLKEGKYVMIEIQDRGIGIPEDIVSKIFDPFFTTKQKGSGLGLSTVFSIIKRHEGCITVHSELGKGSSFFVYLPAVYKFKIKHKEKEKKISKGKGKILIMDDKSFVRNAAVKALKLSGYEVEGVADGAEVVSLYKEERDKGKPFDLVILDLTIPGGMGGEDTLKKLREINPEVKAIVSSGYSDDPVMSEYKKHGFNAIVRKPYQYEELCEVVSKVIQKKKNK